MSQSNDVNDLDQDNPKYSKPFVVQEDALNDLSIQEANLMKRKEELIKTFYKKYRKRSFVEKLSEVVEEAFLAPFGTPLGKFLAIAYVSALALALLIISVTYVFGNLLGPVQVKQVVSLDLATISFLNKCFNFILYAFPAFIFAAVGSSTRLLLSDHTLGIRKSVKLIVGSGCFGILAFLSMESGVIVEFLTNAYAANPVVLNESTAQKSFYKTVLVCFMTGMFSTIIFITIDEKVKLISSKLLSKPNT